MRRVVISLSLLFLVFALMLGSAAAQPAPCDKADGKGIVGCVEKAYPAKLVANIPLAEREANAKFLRDRVIETARCAGLNVGLNLKRGGPSISVDFIAWKNGQITEGVDIIGSWDDLKRPLSLSWHRYKAPNYGHPFYKAYGPVSCGVEPRPDPEPDPEPLPADKELLMRIATLEGRIEQIEKNWQALDEPFNTNAQTLANLIAEFTTEVENRKAQDSTLQAEIDVLKSRVIPTVCNVQFGLRCQLE